MPEPQHYEVTAPNGRKFDLQGDAPPTEADLDEIFAHIDDGTKAPAEEKPSLLSLAGTAVGTAAKDLTIAPFQQAWDVASNAFQRSRNVQGAMQSGDIGTAALEAARANPLVHMVVKPALAMGKRAVEDVRQGRYSEGVARGVSAAAAVPSLGLSLVPAAIGEQIGSGDPRQQAEAVGHIGAAVLGPKVVPKALEGIARIPASVVKAIPHDSPELAPALMAKAMKMSPKEPAVLERVKSAMDDLNEIQRQTGQRITTPQEAYDALLEAKRQNRAQFDQLRDPQAAIGAEVDLTPVADAIDRSIPERVKLMEPEKAAAIRAKADRYRRKFPVLQVEQFLQEGNAALQGYYGENPAARRAGAAANPRIADMVAEVGELRTQLYKTLDRPAGGQAARVLQRRFGALAQLTEQAQKAIPRADISEVTDTLASTLGKFEMARELGGAAVKGVGGLATGNVPMMLGAGVDAARGIGALKFAQWMKWRNSPEGLLVRALNAHTGLPSPIQMPPPVQIRGQLGPGAIQVGPAPTPPEPPITQRGQYGRELRQLGPGAIQLGPAPEPPMAVRGEYGAKWTPPVEPPPAPPAPRTLSDVGTPAPAVIAPEPVPAAAKPVTPSTTAAPPRGSISYWRGDKGEYTGAIQQLHGGTFYELRMLEGPSKGQIKLVTERTASVTAPESVPIAARKVEAPPSRAPRAAKPKPTAATVPAPATVIKPVEPAAPIAAPEKAAAAIAKQVERIIDVSGEKSAGMVRLRVLEGLEKELSGAQQAAGFAKVEVIPQRRGEYVVAIDGKPAASIEKYGIVRVLSDDLQGMTDTKGKTTYEGPAALKELQGKNVSMGFGGVSFNGMTPTEKIQSAGLTVAAAFGRAKGAGQIVMRIPGDGVFTIERNPYAIQTLLDRIKKSSPSMWADLVKKKK